MHVSVPQGEGTKLAQSYHAHSSRPRKGSESGQQTNECERERKVGQQGFQKL